MQHDFFSDSTGGLHWKSYVFRFIFITLFLFILPLDGKFYQHLVSIPWPEMPFYDLLVLTKYQPQFFPPNYPWGQYLEFVSFWNWLVIAAIALIGTVVWVAFDSKNRAYPELYYGLRVLVRYRLAVALIAYGLYKVFQLQLPDPPLSNLLTNYGDFYAWKVYYQTTAISPNYETFLGAVEILAGTLLLYNRTVTLGAGLTIGFVGNIVAVNFYYGLGEQSYSLLLVLFAIFLFAHDVPRLYQLLVREKLAIAAYGPPPLSKAVQKLRWGGRAVVVVATGFIGVQAYGGRELGSYKLPRTPGLSEAAGRYLVTKFVHNGDTIPYAMDHPYRWQEVVFEEWSTLSIKSNRQVTIDKSNGEGYHEHDIDRNYELAGIAGRHFYHYAPDSSQRRLRFQNKNTHHRDEQFTLSYLRPTDTTLVLYGWTSPTDSVYVALKRLDKKYLMYEGRRQPIKI